MEYLYTIYYGRIPCGTQWVSALIVVAIVVVVVIVIVVVEVVVAVVVPDI